MRLFLVVTLAFIVCSFSAVAQDLLKVNGDKKIYVEERIEVENITKSDLFELVQYWFEETLEDERDTIRIVDPESSIVSGVIAMEYPLRNIDEPFLNYIKVTVYEDYALVQIDDIKTFYTLTPLEQYMLRTDGKFRDPDLAYEVEGQLIALIDGISRYIEQNKI